MSRYLPKSLFGQTLLVLLTGLVISQAVGSWIYTADREQAVHAVGGFAAAQRIANLTRLVQEAPPEWRQRIVAALSDQTFTVSLSAQPSAIPGSAEENAAAQAIKDFLAAQMPSASTSQIRVAVSAPTDPSLDGRNPMMTMMGHSPMMDRNPMMGRMMDQMMGGLGGFRDVHVAMPLTDGQWLSFATALPDTAPGFSRQFVISMAVMAVIILGVSIWAVRRVTAPLASLALAAERMGRDVAAPPLPETGTIETRRASRAFNDMQTRLRNLIENRTRLLAAISHDLRTPLTLLRLRAENVQNSQERAKMLSTIAEMDAMVAATLQFARDETTTEVPRPTDVTALLQSIVDDMADAGMPVAMESAQPIVHACRPNALKRAIRNLLDNAVNYGKAARAAIYTTPTAIEITIDDEGLGIPTQQLSRVFEPFYRADDSRSRDTGGTGLGLAIALSIVQAHDGELMLANRTEGGLRATMKLPRAALMRALNPVPERRSPVCRTSSLP
jgi:signal transduction histidine kinase